MNLHMLQENKDFKMHSIDQNFSNLKLIVLLTTNDKLIIPNHLNVNALGHFGQFMY